VVVLGAAAPWLAVCAPFAGEEPGDAAVPQLDGAPDRAAPDDASRSEADVSSIDAPAPPPKPCPPGRGSSAIRVTLPDASFCIDATEATNQEYLEFLRTATLAGRPALCSFKSRINRPEPGPDREPVAQVDWCDAWLFCKWAGKRLCGKVGGGSLTEQEAAEGAQSEWSIACAGPALRRFPYGDTFELARCAADIDAGVAPVGSHPGCVGGFPGLYDMSGNVNEWIDDCVVTADGSVRCWAKGGGYRYATAEKLDCTVNGTARSPGGTNSDVGIRCCAD
jgi:formylglycine-generating enzyme required for sulfatase activity